MGRIKMFTVCLIALSVPAFYAGAGTPEVDDGIDVYFRNTDLLSLGRSENLPLYPDTAPGESKRIDRAFQEAPPPIPHTVEDMYPITRDDNQCLECHAPENAGKDEPPIPTSHFEHPRITHGTGPMLTIVEGYEKTNALNDARFSCNMCHVPQATNIDTPKSKFVGTMKSK